MGKSTSFLRCDRAWRPAVDDTAAAGVAAADAADAAGAADAADSTDTAG
jgi:hypothetical protein